MKFTNVLIQVDDKDLKKLKTIKEKTGESVSAQIRRAIKNNLKKQ